MWFNSMMRFQKSVCCLFFAVLFARCAAAQSEVVINFDRAEITGRWTNSWTEPGVVFTPAHAPTRSAAQARLMFFPHAPSGKKGILSAMADDPIPVRATFSNAVSSVTVVLWGSTGCPARLQAFGADGTLIDKSELPSVPGRKAPGDPVPTVELTVKGKQIAYIQFSGPRVGEFLVAEELRYVPDSLAAPPPAEQNGKP